MLRLLFFITLIVNSTSAFSQANLIFSLPHEYDFKVTIAGHNSTKPQTWQTKFEKLPAGEYNVTIAVSKPNTTYSRVETVTVKADRGYEITYFVIPYDNGLMCRIANYYTIEQVYGFNQNNSGGGVANGPGDSKARVSMYNGKPVLSSRDLADFMVSVNNIYTSSDKMNFFKAQLPKFYSYTDDVIAFAETFYSEADKLALAKLAYDYTIDKQLYFKMSKVFYSSSSMKELQQYIAER